MITGQENNATVMRPQTESPGALLRPLTQMVRLAAERTVSSGARERDLYLEGHVPPSHEYEQRVMKQAKNDLREVTRLATQPAARLLSERAQVRAHLLAGELEQALALLNRPAEQFMPSPERNDR